MKFVKVNKVSLIYALLLVMVSVSFLFTNINYDAEYQLAMGLRILQGDAMITQMWEPHQTSAFLCAVLIRLYTSVTHTTTGLVLFTQMCGYLIRVSISILLYRACRKLTDKEPALLAAMLYFLISPKEVLTPEFGNMQLWFSTLLFLCLIRYFSTEKTAYLLLGAVSLCLAVLSYPSVIITYAAVVILLIKYSGKTGRDIVLFTGTCALIGGTFAGYLLWKNGWTTIVKCLEHALALEPSHTVDMLTKTMGHIQNIGMIIGMLLGVAAIGFAAAWMIGRGQVSGKSWFCAFWFVLQIFLLFNILSTTNRGGYAFPLIVILCAGFLKRSLLSEKEKRFYDTAGWISLMSLIATLILSDNAFLQAVTYMLILICASVLPLYRWYRQAAARRFWKKAFLAALHTFLCLLIFRCLFLHIPIYGRGQICSVLSDLSLIRSGPALGIITDEEGAVRQRDSYAEWKEYVKEGDTVWLLGEPVDTLGYFYENVKIGAPTVMSTPTYNENLLYYWELNPEKYPNVIALSSYYGSLSWDLLKNEWLMQWLEEEYCADEIIDGRYWRYYIKHENN